MKAITGNPGVRLAVALLVTAGLLGICVYAVARKGGSLLDQLNAPSWTIPVIRANTAESDVNAGAPLRAMNNAPFAVTGYVMSKWVGSVHVWISSLSDTLKDLGLKSGDIVQILCNEEDIKDLKSGDWVQLVGLTVNGHLVRLAEITLPQPFGY